MYLNPEKREKISGNKKPAEGFVCQFR